MTVRELIKLLQKENQNIDVTIYMDFGVGHELTGHYNPDHISVSDDAEGEEVVAIVVTN